MLSNTELKTLFKRFGVRCKGIFLKDELDKKKIQPGFYVYNLDSRSDPVQNGSLGTHWVCSIGSEDTCFYFDSFAVDPATEVERFIRTKYDKYGVNNFIVQALDSNMCGWYCLALAIFVKTKQQEYKSLLSCVNGFINLFDDDAKKNDVILQKFINDHARSKGDKFFRSIAPLLKYN